MIFSGIEIDKQVINLIQDFLNARIWTVDLVDHHNRFQILLKGLHEHVARLGQRPFAGIHQKHYAIHNLQGAFHFTAEIAMAGRIGDVDLDAFIVQTRDLGKDGNAPLALQIV